MPELPSGTVTFLFTDVEGSTILLRRLRARYGDVLAAHQRLLRDAVAEGGGSEIDSQGDSFFFAFRRAREAVLAAANAQRALAAHTWPEDGVVRVRMGIHTGEAAVVDGRYMGVAVHRAARISSAGHGGQVLLSQTTHNLLEDEEELPLDLRDLGEQQLKDFERPVRVYQLVVPGLQERFPPLRTGAETAVPAPAQPSTWRRLTGRRRLLIGGVGALAAGAAAAVLALSIGGSASSAVASRSVAVIDPTQNAVVADVQLDSSPSQLAAGEEAVFAVSTDARTVTRIDPRSRKVTATAALPGIPSDVAAGYGAVWVLHSSSSRATTPGTADSLVTRLDPLYLNQETTINTGAAFDDVNYSDPIAVGRGVWVGSAGAGSSYGSIVRINPAKNDVSSQIPVRVGVYGAGAFVADAAATWAVTGDGVIRIDPATNAVTRIPGPGSAGPKIVTVAYLVALGQGKAWAAGEVQKQCGLGAPNCKRLPGVLWRIDPGSNGVDGQQQIGKEPSAIAVGGGAVWVGDRTTRSVWRIDPSSLKVTKEIQLGNVPVDIVVADGAVWVAVA